VMDVILTPDPFFRRRLKGHLDSRSAVQLAA
jgi:hypothetical protein